MSKKEQFECIKCEYFFDIENIGILASLDESCHSMSKMICYCQNCMVKRLEELLTEMKIHKSKHNDYEYLQKLMNISFIYHENRDEVNLILTALSRKSKRKTA